ncbi:MAG: biotin/lipoyl-binding protein [Acidimicrobiales bacterium]|nr:biotin/lipoyl-binding protein [Acidimicrobiales bacterium]
MPEIRSLLIANRGEIARRIIRTAREMGIRTVAVYSDPDRNAPHVREADVSVPLKGASVAETYLNREELLNAAAWQGVDAIHPGYGFLSESPLFAREVMNAGRIWVGPPPETISKMGDKVAAKRVAVESGLPVLPSAVISGDNPMAWTEQVAEIGYPLLVKAAAGGGGRGMRLVLSPDELADAINSARREAASSFGDATVFAERYLPAPRHIEIQVFADTHGTVVHLGERECSIQRRHQKIIEEAPSTAVSPSLRARMGEAATAIAHAIGYVGAGTVEFLLDTTDLGDGGRSNEPSFYFLEMNTRLQVEHPVTEAICGLDLVRLQLQVAAGEPLGFSQQDVTFRGHAIEVRLYAEDPEQGWLPSTGRIHRWEPGPTPGLRYDSSVETGSVVTPHYDPMLAKIIAHADHRSEAARRLVRALRELKVHGPSTNRDYLIEVLNADAFLAGDTHTDFVERHPPAIADDDPFAVERRWQRFNTIIGPHLAAAALVEQQQRTASGPWSFAPTGWRNVGGAPKELTTDVAWRLLDAAEGFAAQSVSYERRGERWDLSYCRVARDHPLARRRRADDPRTPINLYDVAIRGPAGTTQTLVELEDLGCGQWMLHFGRRGQPVTVDFHDGRIFVNSPLGQSVFTKIGTFDEHTRSTAVSGLTAPVPGKVVSVLVQPGESVEPGQTLVVLEAMKVEHQINTAAAGVVTDVLVSVGDSVDAHQVLVRLDNTAD